MLYISLTDQSLELLETKKGLVSDEKFIAVSRKLFKEKVLEYGLISDAKGLVTAFREALVTAYPKEIKDNQLSLVLPGDQVIIKRLPVNSEVKVTPEWIISQAKNYLPQDISHYESYFKEIDGRTGKTILFTALPLSLILSYHHLFSQEKMKINFLSVAPFSVYALLRTKISEGETYLYADLDKYERYYLLDHEGPVTVFNRKSAGKGVSADIKTVLKKLEEEKHHPSKIIISGEKSLESKTEDLSESLAVPVVKMSHLIEEIQKESKEKIDTGGVPLFYFDKTIGLANLTKLADVPNFASDLKIIEERYQKTTAGAVDTQTAETKPVMETIEVVEKEEKPVAVPLKIETEEKEKETVPVVEEPPLVADSITEFKGSSRSGSFSKYIWFVIALAIGLLTVGGYLVMARGGSVNLPFVSQPTATPSPSPVPTLTPTPTIDPDLKKEDLTVSVLNGTDTSGIARQNADSLEESGYTIGTVGNAEEDAAETIIRIKDSKKNYLPLLIGDLKDKFSTEKVETLPEDDEADAVVILGLK
ncbi:MAG: hypothetical protein UV73_C0001G0102 [Candidatus Gottesmanbacteria bacterium GW2011_GWA2_43_14]|uniref:LytR/CpsA/Psr regulator C-terminal domain-containing protein n=1 Tax=Candidatus Gottesmanbacteria bacterium GW2011_GWA2_43_14 TaxID=1618443 RepID=A0A0G1FUA0_9BACT|nr:MAG: hypothetical protein UV73_C0001G0102 [Candidatus Gottesmanbacteria bacterium GW2011_GWA2_43_14]